MDLLLTGTGPASGFPVPDCPCAVCRTASPDGPSGLSPGGRSGRPARAR
jgi:phosphoribosyl 1,2-cyclic phosphodiesterase